MDYSLKAAPFSLRDGWQKIPFAEEFGIVSRSSQGAFAGDGGCQRTDLERDGPFVLSPRFPWNELAETSLRSHRPPCRPLAFLPFNPTPITMRSILLACLLLTVIFASGLPPLLTAAEKPNIIYILSDDMGFSDIGCYGGEIETPHLDSLAQGGIRFTQFYNTARCCPTRASLLTGLYPHQAGIGHMMEDRQLEGYRGDLNDRCRTIAEVLKPAGYRSYAVGKWHVTKVTRPQAETDKFNWPLQRGFDRFYGTITGAGSFFDPSTLTRDNTYLSALDDPEYPGADYYYTDAISDHAVRFVRDHRGDQPFFLYVAYTAAHWPMHARDKDIAKYRGRYAAGYAAIRQARYAKMLREGVISKDSTTLWPMPDELGEKEYWAWDERNMEVFAAMVDSMDQGIGRIVAALRETGKFDNTLICFLQDNGGCAEGMGRAAPGADRAASPSLPALAKGFIQPDMIPKQSRDGFPMRQGKGVMAGGADTYIGYGEAWATVSNTPFRKHKHWVHEGGISTPLIAHWPQGIRRPGTLEPTPGHLIDLMATAVDIADADYPREAKPLEGKSLKPLFEGKVLQREAIYWEHEGNRAVRAGEWKLVAEHGRPWELYNIALDRSEQHDLSREQPARVAQLTAMWDAYAQRANVEPWDKVIPPKQPDQKGKAGKAKKKKQAAD
jgi:arylsulfatase